MSRVLPRSIQLFINQTLFPRAHLRATCSQMPGIVVVDHLFDFSLTGGEPSYE